MSLCWPSITGLAREKIEDISQRTRAGLVDFGVAALPTRHPGIRRPPRRRTLRGRSQTRHRRANRNAGIPWRRSRRPRPRHHQARQKEIPLEPRCLLQIGQTPQHPNPRRPKRLRRTRTEIRSVEGGPRPVWDVLAHKAQRFIDYSAVIRNEE
jgi:hypothetical protein